MSCHVTPCRVCPQTRVLRVINERLQGRYNLAVPRPAGLGAADAGNDLPLSVQGQVRGGVRRFRGGWGCCRLYSPSHRRPQVRPFSRGVIALVCRAGPPAAVVLTS